MLRLVVGITGASGVVYGVRLLQVLNQLQNFVTESSKLVADRLDSNELETTLAGLTLVADFSTGRVVNGTAVEQLVCALGGELFCDGTEIKGEAQGCAACP